MTTTYTIRDDPKMLRETLCVAQHVIGRSMPDADRKHEHIARISRLITECDRHRPLGPNGKHGDRHTPTCGCDDVPLPTWAPSAAVYRAGAVLQREGGEVISSVTPRMLAAALDVEEMARALYEASYVPRFLAVQSWDYLTREAQSYWIALATLMRESILGITQ